MPTAVFLGLIFKIEEVSFHINTLITIVNEYDLYYLSASVSVLSGCYGFLPHVQRHAFSDSRLTLVVKVVVFVQHSPNNDYICIYEVCDCSSSFCSPPPLCPRFHPVKRNFVASSGVRLCYWNNNFAYNRQGPCIMRGQVKNSIDFRPHNCCEPTCFPYSNKKFQPVGGQEWCSEPFDFKLVKGRGPDKTFFFLAFQVNLGKWGDINVWWHSLAMFYVPPSWTILFTSNYCCQMTAKALTVLANSE